MPTSGWRAASVPRRASIVFTGGGTEAINLAVKGAAWARKAMGHRIVTSAVEHKAVLESCLLLEKFGFEILVLPVDRYGRVDPDELTSALTDSTILVSLQLANNEVGTLQPVAELVARVRAGGDGAHPPRCRRRCRTGCPSTSARSGADLVSLAAHKLEGPPASGRSGSGAAQPSCPRSTAAARSATGGRAPRTSRLRWAWPPPSSSRAPNGPTMVPDLASRRDRLRAAVLAIEDVELTGPSDASDCPARSRSSSVGSSATSSSWPSTSRAWPARRARPARPGRWSPPTSSRRWATRRRRRGAPCASRWVAARATRTWRRPVGSSGTSSGVCARAAGAAARRRWDRASRGGHGPGAGGGPA